MAGEGNESSASSSSDRSQMKETIRAGIKRAKQIRQANRDVWHADGVYIVNCGHGLNSAHVDLTVSHFARLKLEALQNDTQSENGSSFPAANEGYNSAKPRNDSNASAANRSRSSSRSRSTEKAERPTGRLDASPERPRANSVASFEAKMGLPR